MDECWMGLLQGIYEQAVHDLVEAYHRQPQKCVWELEQFFFTDPYGCIDNPMAFVVACRQYAAKYSRFRRQDTAKRKTRAKKQKEEVR